MKNKQIKNISLIGGLLALTYFTFNVITAINISKGFGFAESLLPELLNALIVGVIFILPALILFKIKHFKKHIIYIAWLYPIILLGGIINLLLVDDALAAGLPMLLIVTPFCIIFSLILILQKKNN